MNINQILKKIHQCRDDVSTIVDNIDAVISQVETEKLPDIGSPFQGKEMRPALQQNLSYFLYQVRSKQYFAIGLDSLEELFKKQGCPERMIKMGGIKELLDCIDNKAKGRSLSVCFQCLACALATFQIEAKSLFILHGGGQIVTRQLRSPSLDASNIEAILECLEKVIQTWRLRCLMAQKDNLEWLMKIRVGSASEPKGQKIIGQKHLILGQISRQCLKEDAIQIMHNIIEQFGALNLYDNLAFMTNYPYTMKDWLRKLEMLSITLIISSLWDESSCFLIQLTKSYLKFDLLKLKIHSSYDICFNALSLANTIYAIFFSLLGYQYTYNQTIQPSQYDRLVQAFAPFLLACLEGSHHKLSAFLSQAVHKTIRFNQPIFDRYGIQTVLSLVVFRLDNKLVYRETTGEIFGTRNWQQLLQSRQFTKLNFLHYRYQENDHYTIYKLLSFLVSQNIIKLNQCLDLLCEFEEIPSNLILSLLMKNKQNIELRLEQSSCKLNLLCNSPYGRIALASQEILKYCDQKYLKQKAEQMMKKRIPKSD